MMAARKLLGPVEMCGRDLLDTFEDVVGFETTRLCDFLAKRTLKRCMGNL